MKHAHQRLCQPAQAACHRAAAGGNAGLDGDCPARISALGLVLATLFGGACAAGSANAINCYFDRDIDQLMSRTSRRSLPSGRVAPIHALIFGIVAGGPLLCLTGAVCESAQRLAGAFWHSFLCVHLYRSGSSAPPRRTSSLAARLAQCPRSLAGRLSRNSVGLPAIWLFAIIFYWTPPHFWALALLIKNDYARANIPMLPVVKGEKETKRQILLYTLLLLAVTSGSFCDPRHGLVLSGLSACAGRRIPVSCYPCLPR